MEDVVWRAGRSLRSASASDRAAAGRTGLAPGLARTALSALRGPTPSVEVRGARRICATLVPRRQSSWRRHSRYPVRASAPVQEARSNRWDWLSRRRLEQARAAAEAAAPVPTPPESRHAISHRCISRSCDRRSGSVPASHARLRSTPGWVVAAPWRGSDNRTPLRRRGSACWAWFPDRGRSCWSRSNHARSRRDCMRRARGSLPE